MTVFGECFADLINTSNVVCKFNDIVMPADVIDDTHAQCLLPMLLRTGQIPIAFSVNGGHNYTDAGIFTLGKYPVVLFHFVLRRSIFLINLYNLRFLEIICFREEHPYIIKQI